MGEEWPSSIWRVRQSGSAAYATVAKRRPKLWLAQLLRERIPVPVALDRPRYRLGVENDRGLPATSQTPRTHHV